MNKDEAREAAWQAEYAEFHLEPPKHESEMWNLGFDAGYDAGAASVDRECRWCLEGETRIPSSVSDAWVHSATPIGRKVCTRQESPAEQALRSLASFVGSGGYNAPTVDAAEFEAKIREGIDTLIRVDRKAIVREFQRRASAELCPTPDGYVHHVLNKIAKEMEGKNET